MFILKKGSKEFFRKHWAVKLYNEALSTGEQMIHLKSYEPPNKAQMGHIWL